MNEVRIQVAHQDAFEAEGDILCLKYAQRPYGLDRGVIEGLKTQGIALEGKLPELEKHYFTESHGVVAAPHLLFVGTPPINHLDYEHLYIFAHQAIKASLKELPTTKKLLMTLHGPGFGLDETEAFRSQLAGIKEGLIDTPGSSLEAIVFVERTAGRARRMQEALQEMVPSGLFKVAQEPRTSFESRALESEVETGLGLGAKKKIFVAMPFADEFDDIFHYGIQGAVHAAGYLCERADLESFTGNVMEWVRKRIESAEFVIADLSNANPNVYLEVGYAWGQGKRTVLVINDTKHLQFDTRDQRCIPYKKIRDLEEALTNELKALG